MAPRPPEVQVGAHLKENGERVRKSERGSSFFQEKNSRAPKSPALPARVCSRALDCVQLGRYWSLTVMPWSWPGFFSSSVVCFDSSLTSETGARPREVEGTKWFA